MRGKGLRHEVHNMQKKGLQSCVNLKPLLVSISTYSDYYFAFYLNITWSVNEGNYNDSHPFVISANHGNAASIQLKERMLQRSETLIEFGNASIIISLDRETGTVKANAYNVPQPYTADNFLSGKSTLFYIADWFKRMINNNEIVNSFK